MNKVRAILSKEGSFASLGAFCLCGCEKRGVETCITSGEATRGKCRATRLRYCAKKRR